MAQNQITYDAKQYVDRLIDLRNKVQETRSSYKDPTSRAALYQNDLLPTREKLVHEFIHYASDPLVLRIAQGTFSRLSEFEQELGISRSSPSIEIPRPVPHKEFDAASDMVLAFSNIIKNGKLVLEGRQPMEDAADILKIAYTLGSTYSAGRGYLDQHPLLATVHEEAGNIINKIHEQHTIVAAATKKPKPTREFIELLRNSYQL